MISNARSNALESVLACVGQILHIKADALLEQGTGIKPASETWEAFILPLN